MDQIFRQPATSAILDPGFYKAYVWSTGALTQTITVSLAGTYKVTVTDFHDCKGNDEIKVEFWALGINEESENGLNLYPNPTTERVDVEFNWRVLRKCECFYPQCRGQGCGD